jgi:hypothetical protein
MHVFAAAQVVVIPEDARGNIDVIELERACAQYSGRELKAWHSMACIPYHTIPYPARMEKVV